MPRINPFQPNSPVAPGMFAGRITHLNSLEGALRQTRGDRPKHFMLTGERGIGKTSLLQYFKLMAQGVVQVTNNPMNFLIVELDIDANTTDLGLIRRVNVAISRALKGGEPARSFITNAWEFLQRVQALGMTIRPGEGVDPEILHDEFAHSLAQTCERISGSDAASVFESRYDGIVILIDEADNAPSELRLGAFLKLLIERVERHGCQRLMVGLAGMPRLRDVLRESHASSLRLFDELPVGTLSSEEVSRVIDRALTVANESNEEQTAIDATARQALIDYAEGYPHFIQQFGYSAFESDTDLIIDVQDVERGAVGQQGAMEKIGDRYYRDDFYNKIQKSSYRQVLRIMAENGNRWVSKSDIRTKFKGRPTTLDNAIHALRDRNIILTKEGERGVYRLQHQGFAFWIKLYTTEPHERQTQLGQNATSE